MEPLNIKPVTVTFPDGTVKSVLYEDLIIKDGSVTMVGRLYDAEPVILVEKPKEASIDKPYIRSYKTRSALLRFLHEGRLATAAVTHTTDKAWRVLNKDYGVAWVPKHLIRWSEIAQQFCLVAEGYELDFTKDVKRGWDEYPLCFNPDDLIINELYREL